ncbi:MAG: signal peptidase II [Acidobacteriota bacterium]|nr:MAG: signal peptidase II [Acidobacteriota bacterium]
MRILSFLIGFSVFALDLLSKWWVKNTFALHNYPVVDGFLTIQYVRNEGIAFGMLHNLESEWKATLLGAIALVAVGVVVYYVLRTPVEERLLFLAMGLLMGGILGNFVDRLMHGYVFDFITLHWKDAFAWPTFNVADAAITSGVFLILFKTFTAPDPGSRAAVLPLVGLSLAGGAEMSELVAQLQSRYDSISSFEAKFQQRFEDHGIEFTESGIVLMKRPGRMYWEYKEPVRKYFVADGEKAFFYVPDERQVLVSDLDLENSDSPLLFLLGRGNIGRDFEVSEEITETQRPGMVSLRLVPKVPHPEFAYLLLEVSRNDLLISQLTVVEPIGQRNEYRLTDIRLNPKIPDRRFKLDIPSHVEVVEQ